MQNVISSKSQTAPCRWRITPHRQIWQSTHWSVARSTKWIWCPSMAAASVVLQSYISGKVREVNPIKFFYFIGISGSTLLPTKIVSSLNNSWANQKISLPVPCVPTNVETRRSCSQNFVDVMWQASRGAINYTATALDADGSYLKCTSNETSCRLVNVMCGHVYNISVVAVDNTCTSMKSRTLQLQIGTRWQKYKLTLLMCNHCQTYTMHVFCVVPLQSPVHPLSWPSQWTVAVTLPS